MSAVPEIREFGAPFDDQGADIILRSSDAVDFHVYKVILKKGSQGFAEMFSAQPVPPTESGSQEYKGGLPIIQVSETSHALDLFLRFLYPIARPEIFQAEEIALVLDAFRKYVVDGYAKAMESMLLDMLDEDNHFDGETTGSVYALACCYGFPRVAKAAAIESLKAKCTVLPFISDGDISLLTTRQYHALVQFQSTCKDIARNLARHRNWKEDFDVLPGRNPFNSHLPKDDPTCECQWITEDDLTPAWFAFYSFKFGGYLVEYPLKH